MTLPVRGEEDSEMVPHGGLGFSSCCLIGIDGFDSNPLTNT